VSAGFLRGSSLNRLTVSRESLGSFSLIAQLNSLQRLSSPVEKRGRILWVPEDRGRTEINKIFGWYSEFLDDMGEEEGKLREIEEEIPYLRLTKKSCLGLGDICTILYLYKKIY